MNIELPYTVDELVEINRELIRRNGFREDCYMRPYAYKADEVIGVKFHGLQDHFVIMAIPMGDYVSTTGLRCGVSSWRCVDDNAIPARAKITGAYVNSAFAKTEAIKNGFDEAIMLTSEGHVSEGSAENIFLVVGNELVTPPPSENILLGITRDTVMQIAHRELDRWGRIEGAKHILSGQMDWLALLGAQHCPAFWIVADQTHNGRDGEHTT